MEIDRSATETDDSDRLVACDLPSWLARDRREVARSLRGESAIAMTKKGDTVRTQRLQLLDALIQAWLQQPPGQHTDFAATEKGDVYAIRHPGLRTANGTFEASRSDIDAMVKTGYLRMEPREHPGEWTLRIPYQGLDVFDARLGERARPEFERRIAFDIGGDRDEPTERTIDLQGHVYTLTAMRRQDKDDWEARITRYSFTAGAPAFRQPILDRRSEIHDQAAMLNTMRATGPTAALALSDIEARLRIAVDQALRVEDPSGSNG